MANEIQKPKRDIICIGCNNKFSSLRQGALIPTIRKVNEVFELNIDRPYKSFVCNGCLKSEL